MPEQTVEQTIETPVIWDAIALIITSLTWFDFNTNDEYDKEKDSQFELTSGKACFKLIILNELGFIFEKYIITIFIVLEFPVNSFMTVLK